MKDWLQGYSTNHRDAYTDRTRNAEDLNNSFSPMAGFYDRNLCPKPAGCMFLHFADTA